MTTVLITGGLGYIGGRVANYLGEKGECKQIYLTTRDEGCRLPSWARDFHILQLDLLDGTSIERCLRNNHFDVVIHLAAVNENASLENPELALEVNTMGTYRLLQQAVRREVEGLIYLSTFHVYGETPEAIITERTLPQPFHPYAVSHLAAEDIIRFFVRHHGLKAVVFRLSNAFGYPMDKEIDRWTLVFNDFCRQAVCNRRIRLRSHGNQYRDFISLHDVARAVDHFVAQDAETWTSDALYNLGGNCTISILDVAKRVAGVYVARYKQRDPITVEVGPDDGQTRWTAPFRYSVDRLLGTGFRLEGNMEIEIARTMEVCELFLDGERGDE